MNNKEAAKALLEGKTLRIINKGKNTLTYTFNFDKLRLLDSKGTLWGMDEFIEDCEWEEVKEPYKKEVIVNCDACGYIDLNTPPYPSIGERANKKYKVIVEEITE